MDVTTTVSASAIAIVAMGITELAKKTGFPAKFAPWLVLGLNILGSVAFLTEQGWKIAIFSALVAGLASMGLYSGAKSVTGN